MTKKEIKLKYKKEKRSLRSGYKTELKSLKNSRDGELSKLLDGMERRPVDPPKRGLLEEIGNAVTHGVGAVFAIAAFVLMLLHAESTREYVGAAVYFFGLFTMFTVSCLYHSFKHGMAVKRLFRRFDYSCIYLLIGATFAPILLAYVNSIFGTVFFIIQWSVIAFGITIVCIFGPARLKFLNVPLYLILGWCGLFFIPRMISGADYYLFGFVLGGGIIYSIGVIPYALRKRAAHFIWHFFVLGGAVVQWVGVYLTIYLNL